MSLDLEFFNRETNITAKVVCDSVSEQGVRLTTFEIEYPRFIHGELMTHRMLSKNSSSSRAIPIQKMLDQIESNMAIPVYWGKNKSGMQAVEEVIGDDLKESKLEWKLAYKSSKHHTNLLSAFGLHKQVPNRLTEPFQMVKVVITGTDWDNFFNLRIHPDAQPEICMLAYKMYKAMQESEPVELKAGEWHLPFVDKLLDENLNLISYGVSHEDDTYGTMHNPVTLEQAIKLSAAYCASVSYRTEGMTLEKADKIFDMLIKAEVIHASPFEHLATPIKQEHWGYPYTFDGGDVTTNAGCYSDTWEKGVTHMNRQGQLCSGNLRGWVQYRHTLPNNTNWKFDFNERMKLFSEY